MPSEMEGEQYIVEVEKNVEMKTSDGVILRSDIYWPKPKTPSETFPVLLIRTPYNKSWQGLKWSIFTEKDYFPQYGYIVVIQDVRGRYASDGEFFPFRNEAQDGYEGKFIAQIHRSFWITNFRHNISF